MKSVRCRSRILRHVSLFPRPVLFAKTIGLKRLGMERFLVTMVTPPADTLPIYFPKVLLAN